VTDRILIGRISGASGVKGEIKLFHYSGESERVAGIGELFFLPVGVDEERAGASVRGFVRRKVLSMRYRGMTPILLVDGIDTRDAAESLVGAEVYVDRDALPPLGEGSYYVEAITGFTVAGEDGGRIGEVAGVMASPAHDILRVAPADGCGELLLPMVDAFILSVDTDAEVITAKLPDGLADVYVKSGAREPTRKVR
jgi:16S rRNA processing protein RimM